MLNQSAKYLQGIFLHVVLPALIAGIFWLSLKKQPESFILLSAFFMLGIAWLIIRLKLQVYLLKLLALFLPFSFELPLISNSVILFPGELLIGIAALTLLMEILLQPSAFYKYFTGEIVYVLPFLLIFPVNALFSTMPIVSVKFAFINITYLLVFLILLKYSLGKNPQLFIQMISLYSLGFALVIAYATYRFWQYGFNPVVTKGIFRPFYKDHTITGASAAILSTFWFLKAFYTNKPNSRLIMGTAGLFFLYAVLLTRSRAAIISLVFFAVVWGILHLKIHFRYIALAGFLALIIGIGFHRQIYERLYYNKYVSRKQNVEWSEFLKSAGNVTTDDSNVERLNRWYAGIQMFKERPLTGFGPGTYQFAYIPYQKKELKNRLTVKNPYRIPENSGGTAHSEYILALSEMGFFGFTALVLFLGRWVWLVLVKTRFHPVRNKMIIVFAAMSTYLFHAFFNNFLNTDKFAFLFWGMAASFLAVYETESDKKEARTHDAKLLQGS
jgi:putative inorganic carbon (hco3(-)) transporter